MKPQHLRPPFSWESRHILLQDNVFYVPDCLDDYSSFAFPGWESVFGNDRPVHVEYCSGNGAWIAAKAAAHPQVNWVAVEWDFERVRKIWSKSKNHHLSNLFIICAEGLLVSSHFFPSKSVEQVFINFPDPWPKKRHAKHRIVKPPFIQEVARTMKEGGMITLATDDQTYSQQMTEVLLGSQKFSCLHPAPYYATHVESYGTSFFEELFRNKGKTIYYHQYRM